MLRRLFFCSLILISKLVALGEEKVLYIRGEFSDKPMGLSDKKWTKVVDTMHATLDDYWKTHSYGKITQMVSTITPILALPGKTDDYFHYNDLATGMKKAAEKAGFKMKDHSHLVFLYPSIKHNISFGGLGGGGQVWLPGRDPFDGGLIHEIGHSLGLGHSHAVEGESGVTFPGERREGRGGLHMMGSDGNKRIGTFSTINLPMRYHLHFVGDDHIFQVKKSGVYRVLEYETESLPSAGKIGARVQVGEDDFWISFGPKMAARWDNYNSENFAKGVIVHRRNKSITDLLDFTPGSQGGTGNDADYIDTRDGALKIGRSYLFPKSTVKITPVAVGKDGNGLRYIDVEVLLKSGDGFQRDYNIGTREGITTTDEDLGTVVVTSFGERLSGDGDSCLFHARPTVVGDDSMTTTIKSFKNATERSRAGVMIRRDDSPTSAHAAVCLSGDFSVSMIWREGFSQKAQAKKAEIDPSLLQSLSLRVTKEKNFLVGSYSVDGKAWIPIHKVEIDLGEEPLKGLVVTSGVPKKAVEVTFDQS